VINLLLQTKASINIKVGKDQIALHDAVMINHSATINALLRAGKP
jgi:hypothetical protein